MLTPTSFVFEKMIRERAQLSLLFGSDRLPCFAMLRIGSSPNFDEDERSMIESDKIDLADWTAI